MFSYSWRRAPIIGAALLLLPGLASAQTSETSNSDVMPPIQLTKANFVKHAPPKPGALSLKNAWKPNRKGNIFPEAVKSVPGATSTVPNVQKISFPRSVDGPGVNAGFGGLGQQADGLRPGNASVAVSPWFVLQTTEEGLYIFKRDGTPVGGASWQGFLGGTDIKTQPHCIYDHYNNKFVLVLGQYTKNPDSGNVGYFSILSSPGNDALSWGNWFNVSLATSAFGDTDNIIHDSPHLGFNASTLVVAVNGRDFATGGRIAYGSAISSRSLILQSADAGANLGYYSGTFFGINQGFTGSNNRANIPASMYSQKFDPADGSRELLYALHAGTTADQGDINSKGIRIRRFSTNWALSSYAIKDSTAWGVTGLSTAVAPTAIQPGTTAINTIDSRIQSVSYLNNNIDCVQSIALDTGAGPEGASLVWRLDATGTGAPVPTRISAIGAEFYDINYSAPVTTTDGTVNYIVSATSPLGLEATLFTVGWKAGATKVDSVNQLSTAAATPDFNQPVTDAWGNTTNPWGMLVSGASDPLDRRQIFATGSFNPGANKWSTAIYALSYYPATALAVADATTQVGVPVTLTATLTTAGSGLAGATVTISVDGAAAGTGTTDASGMYSVSYTPATGSAGTHTITASFAGDPTYLASLASGTLTVNKVDTTITTSDVSGAPGNTVALAATLTRTSDSAALSGKSITIKVDGTEVAGSPATTDVNGMVSVNYPILEGTVGAHTVSFSFAGDADTNANSGNANLTVSKANTTTAVTNTTGSIGQTVTLKANLSRNTDSALLSGKVIAFTVGGSAAGSGTTDASGNATVSYTIPAGTVGTPTIGASFDGSADANYNSSTGTGTLTVSKAATTTVATSVTGIPGATVTLSATLTRSADSTGVGGKSVKFTLGAFTATSTTNGAGVATASYLIPAATVAPKTLPYTAVFAGDADYLTSTGTANVNVRKPTTLTVTAAKGAIGTAVSLKAVLLNVKAKVVGAMVSFTVDGNLVGSIATDATGTALLPGVIVPGPIGGHAIVATFAGDATYNAATGNGILTATVANTTTTSDAAAISAPAGSNVVIGATLKNSSASPATALGGMTMTCPPAPNGTTNGAGHVSFTVKAPAKGKKATFKITFPGTSDYKTSFTSIVITGT